MAAAAAVKIAEKTNAAKDVGEKDVKKKDVEKDDPRWRAYLELPCRLTIDLSVPAFTVGDFLALRPGSIVGTQWGVARDVPLRINEAVIGWAEMEGVGTMLAVRLTELA